MQQRIPLHLLGRASGVRRQAMYTGMLLGALAALGLAGALGWQATVLVVGAGPVGLTLAIDLGMGDAVATAWTCDLSYDYIKINASYRS